MKKQILLLVCLLVCYAAAFSQSVTLTFTAKDAANQYVQLNRVVITNLTQIWHVPSDAGWTQMTNYVGGQLQYQCSDSSISSILKSDLREEMTGYLLRI